MEHHHPTYHHHHESIKSIRFAFFVNIAFTLIEIVGGLFTNSVAILSDALHDLGDSISLGLSWYFEKVSKRKRDVTFTYGYGRFSLLAAFINGVVLIIGSLIILFVALPRFFFPQPPDAQGMIYLSLLGILFNGLAVLRLKKGQSMNEKVVSWHLLEDVLGWVAVLVVSIIMYYWHLPFLDPLLSLIFTSFILFNVVKNFRKTLNIFLQSKPENINLEELQLSLLKIRGIRSLHDVHMWTMDGDYYIMTLHMVVHDETANKEIQRMKKEIRELSRSLNIQHLTIETEFESENCDLGTC